MYITYDDQINFAKLALALYDIEKDDIKKLKHLLAVGEMIKKHTDKDNWIIFDTTEYIYERIRLLQGDERAFEDTEQRKLLEDTIRHHTP
jgi:hypothetical protein